MQTLILDIIPRIKMYSKKLNELALLTDKHWVLMDENLENKIVFIFRKKGNQLLISKNGNIEKGDWEYLGNNSLLIDRSSGSFLFKHGFIDDNVLALKVDGKKEYALFVNEQKFDDVLNSVSSVIDFLNQTYIEQDENVLSSSNESYLNMNEENTNQTKIIEPKPKITFNSNNFPRLNEDLYKIKAQSKNLNKNYLPEIIIGFAKEHLIKGIWAKENPDCVNLVVNKKLPIGTLETLFEDYKNNLDFREDLEHYVNEILKK